MVVQGNSSVSMTIPDITGSGYITVSGGMGNVISNGYCSPVMLSTSPDLVIQLAIDLLHKEMRQVEKTDPEIDLNKVTDMLNSDNMEMFELGLTIVNQNTKYCRRIIQGIKDNNPLLLQQVIEEYQQKNKFNLTSEIR